MKVGFILSILLATSVLTGCSMGEEKSKAYAAKKASCTLDYKDYRTTITESLKAKEEVKEVFKSCLTISFARDLHNADKAEVIEACSKAAYDVVGVRNIQSLVGEQYEDIYTNVIKCGGK